MDEKLCQPTGASCANTGFAQSTKGILISTVQVKKELLKPQPFQYIIILICLYGGSHFVTEVRLAANGNVYVQTITSPEIF